MRLYQDNIKLELYNNTSFAGLFVPEDKMNPISVKSRTAILLKLAEVLVIWSLKLQSEIIFLL